MKHHNKHFITALSMIVLIIVGAGLLLWNYEGNVVGFSVMRDIITIPSGHTYTETSGAVSIYIYPSEVTFGNKKGQVFITTVNGEGLVTSVDEVYNLIKDQNKNTYFATTKEDTTYYTLSGEEYTPEEVTATFEGETVGTYFYLQNSGSKSDVLTDEMLSKMAETLNEMDIQIGELFLSKEEASQAAHTAEITAFAQSMSSSGISESAIQNEETAINNYLHKEGSQYSKVSYDVTTGQYSGTFGSSEIAWDSDRMYVTSEGKTYYSEKKNGRPVYYECTKDDCSQANILSGDDAKTAKTAYKTAEDAYEKLQETINDEMEKCKKDKTNCQLTTGKTAITESVRQSAYLNSIYEQQERQAVGVLTGYLNKWINKVLGSWSRGVPAGICRIFGLEYYKNQGWMAMPANTSATQLQSTLIENSRTIGIDGEKEEITENLYRYAYTIRLLSNASIEWTTYLYNSCAQKDSTEQFYDYGALGSGDYYAFHYAGAGEQDMIFDCATEDCLYDQACVQFSDSAPVCVSLVHGEGFTTPTAGSDYDCAIS
jgi:hypothetical protein